MSLTASVEGVDRLVGTLDDAAGLLVDLAPPPQAGDVLVAAARPRTPYDRGFLVDTVQAGVVDQAVVLSAGTRDVYYAAIVHARRPWLADTIADQADTITQLVVDQVDDVIDTITGA